MNITQRHIALVLFLLFVFGGSSLILLQALSGAAAPLTVLIEVTSLYILCSLLIIYWCGWEWARYAIVIAMMISIISAQEEPYLTGVASFSVLLPPILALMFLPARWVIAIGAATQILMMVRAEGVGVYTHPITIALYAMIVVGIAVARHVADNARIEVEAREQALLQAEAELRETTRRLHLVISNAPVVLAAFDAKGTYTLMDGRALHTFNREPAALVGQSFLQLFADRPEELAAMHRALAGEAVSWISTVESLSFENYLSPVYEHKRVTGVIGLSIDITERRRAEEELQRQRDFALQVMNTMGQGLTVTDAAGRFEYVNPAYAQFMGYQPDDLIGKTPFDVTATDDYATLQAATTHRRAGESTNYTSYLQRADGEKVYALITGVPRMQGEHFAGAIAVITDLTERHHMEQALAQARDAAVRASQFKSDFLATMSHEIRTPLNGVIGLIDLLKDTQLTHDQHEYVHLIADSAAILLRIINDALDLAKVEAGKLELHSAPFDLQQVVTSTIAFFQAVAHKQQITMQAEIADDLPTLLLGDNDRLRQVLLNLIGNALKFTDQGGVTVRVMLHERTLEGVVVRIEVADTGIGITPATQQRLFQPFVQADTSTTRKYGGTGLGLAISQRLVNLMKGAIGVVSALGQGSTFWFTAYFPLAPTTTVEETAPITVTQRLATPWATAAPHNGQPLILLAEDNPTNQALTLRQLSRLGYGVEVAKDGNAALEAFLRRPNAYALILMDCNMPNMDGFAATQAIRQAEQGGMHVPIIALTANAMPGDSERCLAVGMDDHLTKPITLPTLRERLVHWLVHDPPVVLPTAPPQLVEPSVYDEVLNPQTLHDLLALMDEDGASAFRDLVAIYRTSSLESLRQIQAAVEFDDPRALVAGAHSLKGMSASLGALELAKRAAAIELVGRAGSTLLAYGQLEQLEREYARAEVALAWYEQRLNSSLPRHSD